MKSTQPPPDTTSAHEALVGAQDWGILGDTFGDAARFYTWGTPIPLPSNAKQPPPAKTTGRYPAPSASTAKRWASRPRDRYEVGLRLPPDVIGLDVDQYGRKTGLETIAELELVAEEPLPPTFVSTGRDYASGSGIRVYRLRRPVARDFVPRDLPSVETIHHGHRYMVVWPSVVVDDTAVREYRWYGPDGAALPVPPDLAEVPYLPASWEELLFRDDEAETFDPDAEVTDEHRAQAERVLQKWLRDDEGEFGPGNRNNYVNAGLFTAYGFVKAGALDRTREEVADLAREAFPDTGADPYGFEATEASAWDGAVPALPRVDADEGLAAFDGDDDDDQLDDPETRAEARAEAFAKSSWAPLNLAETFERVADGTLERVVPTVGELPDGSALFYAGRINGVAGDSAAGKSWTAILATVQELRKGNHVLFVDYEDTRRGFSERLLRLGATAEDVTRLGYVEQPETTFDVVAREGLKGWIRDHRPTLAVIDSVGESLAMEGRNPNADEEVALWFKGLPKWLAHRGAAVVLLDHLPKDTKTQHRFAIGSQRKRAAITGAQYVQTVVEPFSTKRAGFSRLMVTKDRLGNATAGDTVAELRVDPGAEVLATFAVPEAAAARVEFDTFTDTKQRIMAHVQLFPGQTLTKTREAVGGKSTTVSAAVESLVTTGHLRQEPRKGGGFCLYSVRPYAPELEDLD